MPTLFDPAARAALVRRLDGVRADATPRWGRMGTGEVLGHLEEALRHTLGETEASRVASPLRWPGVSWLAIHVLPWPKGKAKSPPEFLGREVTDVEAQKARVRACIERFAARRPSDDWPESPVFGRLGGRSWGVLSWRHLDHHLRQLGA